MPFNASRALGCRSPRAQLKHTHPRLSALSGIPLCFNHWLVQLLPRFCPQMRPWRTFRTASATLRPVFAPVAGPANPTSEGTVTVDSATSGRKAEPSWAL